MKRSASGPVFGLREFSFLALVGFLVGVVSSPTTSGQGLRRSGANTQQIDPVRPGDHVEVKFFSDWYPGTVISFADGKASVEYDYRGRKSTRDFSLSDMRFPNGEGQWAIWKDSTGKFKVEARYIARDETSVMIRKADGTELTIPIDKLSLDLRQRVKKTPITGEENKIDGAEPVRVGDRVQVQYFSSWYDGVVKKVFPGEAEVDYEYSGRTSTKKFALKDIRFPNGEGRWREWSDASGQFKIIARYISRTATEVTIRKEDGSDLTVPIDRLSGKLKRLLAETPITGQETMVDGVNPIRVGDQVEVRSGSSWVDGVIKESRPGAALVEYKWGSSTSKKEFQLKDIRYPNGEGHWRKWADDSGSFEVTARYLRRNATHATLMKEDGSKINVPIDRLSSKLQRMMAQTLAIAPQPEKIEFAMSPKMTSFLSNAPSFAQLSLSDLESPASFAFQDGGFGFQLTHGDSISAAIPTGGSDPWVAVGTYATTRFNGPRLTRLYWTKPDQRQVVPGPNFPPNQRIVDYSASQGRVITMQVSEGTWEQPEMFLSYRVAVGQEHVKPEAAWDIAEKKKSYGRGSSYLARLVGDNQLLLADGKAVSLYDFGSARIVYTLTGLAENHFTLHPTKRYFVVVKESGDLSMHETSSGRQVAAQPKIDSSCGVGFSQDGGNLVRVGTKEVTIWDLLQGDSPRTLRTRNLSAGSQSRIAMLDDEWIWANSYIYNIDKEMVVWSYSGSGVKVAHSEMLGNHMLVAGTTGSYRGPTTALVGIAEVPHQDAIDETSKVDAESMIMLKPGAGVKIEAPGDARIRSGLLRAIQANGWHEDPSSEIILAGSAKRGESKTMTYESSRFGFGFQRGPQRQISETVTASPWEQSVSITFRGKRAWSTGAGGIPYSLYLKEGQTVSGEVAKATQPSYHVFENLRIPGEMLYPQYKYGLGRTSITVNGFQDQVNQLGPSP